MRAPGGRGSSSGHGRDDESDEEPRSTDVGRGMTGGSDEMLMTLLAGQAAVDCEQLPIGGWEEVDSWKKVSRALNHADTELSTRSLHCYRRDWRA
jgi:hypothetical protein